MKTLPGGLDRMTRVQLVKLIKRTRRELAAAERRAADAEEVYGEAIRQRDTANSEWRRLKMENARLREAAMPPPAVHALRAGQAVCGFGLGKVPSEWPPGHQWTNVDDRVNISCEECLRNLSREGESVSGGGSN